MNGALAMNAATAAAEGFLAAVFTGAAVAWLFNNVLTRLRESPLKKVAPLGLLPLAALAGAAHAWAAFHDHARLGVPVWLGLGILLWCGFDAVREVRRNSGTTRWTVRTGLPSVRERELSAYIPRPVLRLLPLNRPGHLRWSRTELRPSTSRPAVPPVRMVFLADFHLHPFLNTDFVREAIRIALDSEPDVVLLGGDFASKRAQHGEAAALLRSFNWPENTYAVRGNHEFWTDPSYFARTLQEAGIQILTNEWRRVRTAAGAEMLLLGLEVPYVPLTSREEERLRAQVRTAEDEAGRLPRVALVHTPESYARAAAIGCDLVMGGHTHGGQVRLPLFGTTISSCSVPRQFVYGMGRINGTVTLTTNGLGAYYGIRWRCPPEVNEVVLQGG